MENLGAMRVTRRAVLGGAVAVGAAAVLAEPTMASAATARRMAPMVPITGPARVGATFNLYPFTGTLGAGTVAEWKAAVKAWNAKTGTTMSCWKVYYQPSEFPTKIEPQIRTIIELGIQALISFKPAIGTKEGGTPGDNAKLGSAVEMFAKAGLTAEVCLWQEVGPRYMTATKYHQYVAYYADTVRQYYPLVFDAPGYQGAAEWKLYDPGHTYLDGYAVDFYCSDYVLKGVRLDPLLTLAGDLPVGVWEMGNTASPNFTPTVADVNAYMTHITSTLSGRLAQGKPVGSAAWYNGPADAEQSGGNELVGTDPCALAPTDIADYRVLWTDVNGKSPS
jgi:hypothetical protein